MCQGLTGIVVQGVSGQEELRTAHLHVIVEDGHLRVGVILTPVGSQRGLIIDHLTTFKEIGIVIDTVVVEAVGKEGGLLVLQDHIITGTGHLLVTTVIGIVTEQRQGVALIHLHMTEGFKGIGGFVEIGTVAIETRTLMREVDLAIEDRGVAVDTVIVVKHIGMNQIDTFILHRGLTSRTTLLLLRKGRDHP